MEFKLLFSGLKGKKSVRPEKWSLRIEHIHYLSIYSNSFWLFTVTSIFSVVFKAIFRLLKISDE